MSAFLVPVRGNKDCCEQERHGSRDKDVVKSIALEPIPQRSERRLPMELTGTVTAILALVSFGFVAAIILGMI